MGHGTIYLMVAELMFVLSGWIIHIGSKRVLGLTDYGIFGILLSLLTLIVAPVHGNRKRAPMGGARADSQATCGGVRPARLLQSHDPVRSSEPPFFSPKGWPIRAREAPPWKTSPVESPSRLLRTPAAMPPVSEGDGTGGCVRPASQGVALRYVR